MDIRRVRVLRGPNLWADFPVVEVCCDLSGHPPDQILESSISLYPRLSRWLPGLKRLRRLPRTDSPPRHERWLAQMFLETILELAAQVGERPTFAKLRHTSEAGVYLLAFQAHDDLPTANCVETALALVTAALGETHCDAQALLGALHVQTREAAPSPTCAALMTAARMRGIPVRRLSGEVLQLGYGVRQRRLLCTGQVALDPVTTHLTRNRDLLDTLLAATGLTCTETPVTDSHYRILVVGRRVLAALWWQPGADGSAATLTDVTSLIHEEIRLHALDVARTLGLEMAEVRVVAVDISRPLKSQGGQVSDIIASPPLDGYLDTVPSIADAVLEMLYRPGETGRIPLVAVSGTNGKTTVTRLIAHGLSVSGRFVGMTCTDGIYLADRRIDTDDCAGPQSARLVLLNPQVDAAVLETARGGILREGLGFDACSVAVVTNIGEGDHLGLGWIDTVSELAEVKQTVVRGVASWGTAVLNADDPLVARMARHCKGEVLFFARDDRHPLILRQRRAGRRVVFVRGQALILATGAQEWTLLHLGSIPLTRDGQIGFQVENALAGAAALWALDLPLETLATALETFGADLDKSPGRFNVLAINGATVVFDYGHNPSALLAMINALTVFPHRRRLAVYSAAGDRRDADLIRQGEILGHAFDQVILYEDHYIRGRLPGEIMSLFSQGLAAGERVSEIQTIHGWQHAVDAALWLAQPGDLLLIQADVIDETVEYVRRRLAASPYWESNPPHYPPLQTTPTDQTDWHTPDTRYLTTDN